MCIADNIDDKWIGIRDFLAWVKLVIEGGLGVIVPSSDGSNLVITRGDGETWSFAWPANTGRRLVWTGGIELGPGDIVRYNGADAPTGTYAVLEEHVSDDNFNTDLTASRLIVIALDGAAGANGGGEAGVLCELSYGGVVGTSPIAVAADKLTADEALADEIEFTAMSVTDADVHLEVTVIPADDPGSPSHLGPVVFSVGDVSSDVETVSAGGEYPAGTKLLLTVWTSSGTGSISGVVAVIKRA